MLRQFFSEVVVGDHDTSKSDGEQKVSPKEWIIHPSYKNQTRSDNDFAIIKLASPVKFRLGVSPICLPSGSGNYDNKNATVSGWGTLSTEGKQPTILQKVCMIFLSSPSPSPLNPIPIGTGADNKVLWATTTWPPTHHHMAACTRAHSTL